MKMMNQLKSGARAKWAKAGQLFVFGILLSAPVAWGATVNFADEDRGQASSLQIGDITISMSPYGSNPPATVAGAGLGLAGGIGLDSQLNYELYYPVGEWMSPAQASEGWLYLNVNGVFNSVTILPELHVYDSLGGVLPDAPPFELLAFYPDTSAVRNYYQVDPANGAMTIVCPSYASDPPPTTTGIGLLIAGDNGEAAAFWNYRQQHLLEEQTIRIGISVISLDYTPVPEPSAAALLGLGLLGLYCCNFRPRIR